METTKAAAILALLQEGRPKKFICDEVMCSMSYLRNVVNRDRRRKAMIAAGLWPRMRKGRARKEPDYTGPQYTCPDCLGTKTRQAAKCEPCHRNAVESKDLGQRFGRLVVLSFSERKTTPGGTHLMYNCVCDCGETVVVSRSNLRAAKQLSCGCYRRDKSRQKAIKHKGSRTPIYASWVGARRRCENPSDRGYAGYGGRGIKMCEKWRNSFLAFADDMGPRPEGTTLDRIDVNKGYSPDNCRWATSAQQSVNTRRTRNIVAFGMKLSIVQWSRKYGVSQTTISNRLGVLGWTPEDAVSVPTWRMRMDVSKSADKMPAFDTWCFYANPFGG